MPGHDIIVLGASAGGVEALVQVVRALPPDLPASLFVVLHVSPHGTSLLPQILSRQKTLPAAHAVQGEPIVPGRIYVAPPDYHLLVRPGQVVLSRGPTENGVRPSVDPLFRTAARAYGRRVVGVVLSGTLDDGSAGLAAIKVRGGVAVVQSPDDALFSGMPRSALEAVEADHCLPLAGIAPALVEIAHSPVPDGGGPPVPDDMEMEAEIAEFDLAAMQDNHRPGTPSGFGCPDCGGTLWELHDGELIRFRCRVGHAWSPTSLLAEQSEALETALWTALRALEERSALAARLAERLEKGGNLRSAGRFRAQAQETKDRAAVIRQLLLKPEPVADGDPPASGESAEPSGGVGGPP